MLALATGLGVALLGIVMAANTVGYGVAEDDPTSGDRFLVATAVIALLGLVAAVTCGRNLFPARGPTRDGAPTLVVAGDPDGDRARGRRPSLVFSPTGYFSRVDGSDPKARTDPSSVGRTCPASRSTIRSDCGPRSPSSCW